MSDSELVETDPVLPPKTHPNYRLWANYAKFARERGRLVADILESFMPLEGLRILDVGCGAGGTSLVLAEKGAEVTAIDFNGQRVEKLRRYAFNTGAELSIQEGQAEKLAFQKEEFDCVILQDVLEHISDPEKAIHEANRVLKGNGLLYLSTPNRWSPFNLISDPHWNLPLVSILPRKWVAYFITKIVRREKFARQDFAALLSILKIQRLLKSTNFTFTFVNKRVVRELFERPKAVVNSDSHLHIVKWLRKLKLERLLLSLVNNKFGFFNAFINPTWYIVASNSIVSIESIPQARTLALQK